MSIPLYLTISRILLTFIIMALLFTPGALAKSLALGGFVVAGITDWLDGYLARKSKQVSALGALLDPIADKVLVLGMFLAFVQMRLIPAWMVLIVLIRELVITGVRLVAARGRVVLAAEKAGKHKTASQMVTIFLVLAIICFRAWCEPEGVGLDLTLGQRQIILVAMWITVVMTLYSGASFFWRQRYVLLDQIRTRS